MNGVLRYKVKKLLETNIERTPEIVAKSLGREDETGLVRKIMFEVCPEDMKNDPYYIDPTPPRTSATLDELVAYVMPRVKRDGIKYIQEFEYFPTACGCCGPQNGEPLCSCAMNAAVYKHKNDILMAISVAQQAGVEL